MSSSDFGGFSASSLARFRADATLRVDSATGQLRVTDRKNPFQRVVTWVRDALGLRSKDAVDLEKNEIRGAYNRFFTSVADDLHYREQTPALQETLAPHIIGNNPKPLSVRMVRTIMADLEQSAPRGTAPRSGSMPAGRSTRENEAEQPERDHEVQAGDLEQSAPKGTALRSGSMPARLSAHGDEAEQPERDYGVQAGDLEQSAPRGTALRSRSMPARLSAREDEAEQLEWDYEAQAGDPDESLQEEFDRITAGFTRAFPDGEDDDVGRMQTDEPAADDTPELDPDAAMTEPDDAGPAMNPYQTVFIDDLDDADDAAVQDGERSVEAIVQQRLLAIAERIRDEQTAAAGVKVMQVIAESGPGDHDGKVAEARAQRDALAATLEQQLHPGHTDVVDAAIEDVYTEIEQLEIEAMATEKETADWQRLRERFLRLEQELEELERLQQA